MILLIISAVLLILIAVYFYVLNYFFTFALVNTDKFRFDNLGLGGPYEKEVLEGRKWLSNNDREKVSIVAFDGLELTGHFFPADNARRTVIFFHGWRGSWICDFAPFAKSFNEAGCNVLVVEQRGQRGSKSRYMGMGLLERNDVHSWLDWYISNKKTKLGELPVYLMGVSMGAATVMMSAGRKLPSDVAGIIADCGFTSPYRMFQDVAKRLYHVPEFPLLVHLGYLAKKKAGIDLKEETVKEALEQYEVPILFVHGKADDFVLPQMTQHNYDICKSEKDILYIEGAGHCMSYLVGKREYQEKLKEFWMKNDD